MLRVFYGRMKIYQTVRYLKWLVTFAIHQPSVLDREDEILQMIESRTHQLNELDSILFPAHLDVPVIYPKPLEEAKKQLAVKTKTSKKSSSKGGAASKMSHELQEIAFDVSPSKLEDNASPSFLAATKSPG